MAYAILVDGAAVELTPGEPFATAQLVVGADETDIYEAEAGAVIDRAFRHAPNALSRYSAADLARFRIQVAAEPVAPEGQVLDTRALVVTDGVISVSATFVDAPPAA
ncbi:hypothetical protein [Phenylobacterium sp.]|uniref:hypothetical protein n=1 Tax=Phenylobacterium sp. TaxID=1871053 RepID=UPI0035B3B720